MVAHGGQDEGRSFDLDGSGATPLTSEDPRRIGPFPVVGLLGVGGMGRVYLAVTEDRYTAVKRVHPVLAQDPDFLRHFKHELDNLARLPAGVSVPLLATDRTANPPWFATEYIPGVTLTEAVHLHGGPLPRAALWYLLRELAARLKALHALDMLHRDVKPSNVMLTLDGLALIDFGIARAADQSRLTKTGMVLGTPEYMAPEQAQAVRPLTAAADVFALGSLLFFAATGASPFGPGSGLEVLYRIVHTEPDLSALRGLDRELADLVAACLDKSPAARPTAADLLDRVAEGAAPAAADWPAAVAEQLERRAAFAAAVPALDELTSATVDLKPAPPAAPAAAIAGAAATGQEGTSAEQPPAGPPEAGGDPEKRVRPPETPKRRSRKLVLIIPVVLAAGGVSAVTLLPYAFSHTDGKPSAAPSSGPSVSSSADRGGPSSSARPGHSTSASASASGHSSGAGAKSGATSGAGAKKSGTGSAGGTGGSHSGGSGTSGGSGGTSGGGSSSSGGSSSGGSSGGSGGGGGTTKIGSAGTYRIKNASNGRCLELDTSTGNGSMFAQTGTCSPENSPYYEWTFKPASSGTFEVINKGNGYCLTGFLSDNWVSAAPCGSTGQYWRIGSAKSAGSTLENTSSWQCMNLDTEAKVTACNASSSSQLWSYAGKG
ncbi:protein kinase [Streptomyces sp. NPDC088194]|uniref:serine/threonine-protein kinase n=1 Tax=Streptomyces sp. NPDC088194 TaxID=3154931 RepID=UPI003450292D